MTTPDAGFGALAVFDREEEPRFSLVREPWIPVRELSGGIKEVSLNELFLRAHELKSIAESNPLTKFALLRLITGLAYLILDGPDGSPKKPGPARARLRSNVSSNLGFDPAGVEDVLTRWDDRLWLFHPSYPFLQDPMLAYDTSIKPNEVQGPRAITPFLPGKSSSRWGVNVDASESLSLAATCRHLTVHWFYSPAGNSARRTDPKDSSNVAKRVLSAALPNFPTLTQFARRGSTFYATIVGNLVGDLFPAGDKDAFPAWLAVPDLSLNSEVIHPLSASTMSCSTALIVGTSGDERNLSKNFLTGPVIFDRDYRKPHERLANRAIACDPHTIFDPNPNEKPNHPRRKINGTFTGLTPFCFELCRAEARSESVLHGVTNSSKLVVSHSVVPDFDILQINQGGTGSGRTLEQAETFSLFAASLYPGSAGVDAIQTTQFAIQIDEGLRPLFDKSKSVRSSLRYAVKLAVAGGPNDARARQDAALALFLAATSESVQTFISQHSLGHDEQPTLPTREVSQSAMIAFDTAAGDLRYSQRNTVAYWQARNFLATNLRKALDGS